MEILSETSFKPSTVNASAHLNFISCSYRKQIRKLYCLFTQSSAIQFDGANRWNAMESGENDRERKNLLYYQSCIRWAVRMAISILGNCTPVCKITFPRRISFICLVFCFLGVPVFLCLPTIMIYIYSYSSALTYYALWLVPIQN